MKDIPVAITVVKYPTAKALILTHILQTELSRKANALNKRL